MPWPTVGGQQAADGGYDILLAWQPRLDRRRVIFADVLAGEYDDYLTRFFTMAAAHPGQVMIRLAHEMNGTGYPWALGYRGENGSGSPVPPSSWTPGGTSWTSSAGWAATTCGSSGAS